MPACKCALLMLALAATLAPLAARADFSDDYVDGLAALDHGEFDRAVQALKKALAARPESPVMIRVEGVPQPYLPRHFLGIAYFKLGDCTAANAQWNDAANLRSLGRLRPLRAQEEQFQAQCKPSTAKAEPPPRAEHDSQPAAASLPSPPVAPAATKSAAAGKAPALASASAPPALLRAFDDLMAGRYANAARLDVDAVNGANVRFQAYLLRSAARFYLSRSGDASQLTAARSDARAARQLEKSEPDERVFSPAFRTFYASAR